MYLLSKLQFIRLPGRLQRLHYFYENIQSAPRTAGMINQQIADKRVNGFVANKKPKIPSSSQPGFQLNPQARHSTGCQSLHKSCIKL